MQVKDFVFTLSRNPVIGLSGFSHLISSSSSSLGDTQVVASLFASISMAALGIRGEGKGVGRGVGKGVGNGVGNSRIGERHLFMLLGTSSRIDGGWRRLLPDDDDLYALSGSST